MTNSRPKKQPTLCFSCKRLDCTWMKNLEPVAGWDAKKTVIRNRANGKMCWCQVIALNRVRDMFRLNIEERRTSPHERPNTTNNNIPVADGDILYSMACKIRT